MALETIVEPTLPENPSVADLDAMLTHLRGAGVLESTALIRGLRAFRDTLEELETPPDPEALAMAFNHAYQHVLAAMYPGPKGLLPSPEWEDLPVAQRENLTRAMSIALRSLKTSRDYRRFYGAMRQRDVEAVRQQLLRDGWTPPASPIVEK